MTLHRNWYFGIWFRHTLAAVKTAWFCFEKGVFCFLADFIKVLLFLDDRARKKHKNAGEGGCTVRQLQMIVVSE